MKILKKDKITDLIVFCTSPNEVLPSKKLFESKML